MDLKVETLTQDQVKMIKDMLNAKVKSTLKIDETEVIVDWIYGLGVEQNKSLQELIDEFTPVI